MSKNNGTRKSNQNNILYMNTAYSNKCMIMTRKDAYLTAVSLELSPEHGMMSVSVYLNKKLRKYGGKRSLHNKLIYFFF